MFLIFNFLQYLYLSVTFSCGINFFQLPVSVSKRHSRTKLIPYLTICSLYLVLEEILLEKGSESKKVKVPPIIRFGLSLKNFSSTTSFFLFYFGVPDSLALFSRKALSVFFYDRVFRESQNTKTKQFRISFPTISSSSSNHKTSIKLEKRQ